MDIASQIVTAIVTGAVVAGKDVANSAIKDAYEALKDGVRALLKRPADNTFTQIEADPKSPEAREKLKDAIGIPAETDFKKLTEKIETLLKTIAGDEKSKLKVNDNTLNIKLELDKLILTCGINGKGFDVVNFVLKGNNQNISGGINFYRRLGNE